MGYLEKITDDRSRFAWEVGHEERLKLHGKWLGQGRQQLRDDYVELAQAYSELQRQISGLYEETKRSVVRSKKVIGCTTTGATMYQSLIQAAEPVFVLVEEAGEIQEAHVVAALSPSVQQLCLIGDHKQLRPKVSSFKLTVEKGDGWDLNLSLFERLIRQGHHFTTLTRQHRSHPEISRFSRLLAYKSLEDSEETWFRPALVGFRQRVIFVHHEKSEDELLGVRDRRDPDSKASKKNEFEAKMILKTVKYRGQQGYSSNEVVVLAPYLSQLSLLKQKPS
ncbi:hypothetical protein CDD83_499 [Cordyceps sp. RAO-2017]|nr:hypothetical protein CDD83_499 [Cordyceps sp. RAO-2017]